MVKKILLSIFAVFFALNVNAQDIYVAGYEYNNNSNSGRTVAKVWKNGTQLYALTNGTYEAQATSIVVSGNDVYVAGYEMNSINSGNRLSPSVKLFVF